MEILKWLDASPAVRSYQVLDFKTFGDGRYYKLKVEMVDRSVLHAREYATSTERNYAFHWQDELHALRIRWDNAPHHRGMATYPHHKHVGSEMRPSKEITFHDVLKYIEAELART